MTKQTGSAILAVVLLSCVFGGCVKTEKPASQAWARVVEVTGEVAVNGQAAQVGAMVKSVDGKVELSPAGMEDHTDEELDRLKAVLEEPFKK